jgi:hypothetical protein
MINYFEELYTPLVSEHIYRWNIPADIIRWNHNIETLRLFAIQRPQELYGQIEDNFSDPFVLFPNPSNEFINIDFFDIPEHISVDIFNVNGQLVYSQEMSEPGLVTIFPGLESGTYMIQLSTGQNIYYKKLIVLR